jgi:adenosyl cobinamide kinase/adenosyl cobinamide phosphate guanylyltransferase
MSWAEPAWRRVLVLGGIRSGKSELAEELVTGVAPVRYVATGRRGGGDPDWELRIDQHQARRPSAWTTSEAGDAPDTLTRLLGVATPAEVLLVDDLGGWVGTVIEFTEPSTWPDLTANLVDAVGSCPARMVLVSPEVGLSLVPATAAGRAFADTLGALNRSMAAVCDIVVLVIAGNAVPVKGRL